jgi:acetyl esterase/lipase
MLRIILATLALLCSVSAASIAIWIVVPAQTYRLWQVAVGATEWSLWFGALGLLGAALGVGAWGSDSRWPAVIAIGLGLLAAILALIPPWQSHHVARENNLELSLRRYLWGSSKGLPVGEPQTVTFATVDGQSLALDVYMPDNNDTDRPAIIVIHGGSWSAGEKSGFPRWNRWLAEQGLVVLDIEYQLQPQPNWQSATGDVKCAIGWVKQHAAQYGVDPNRIAVLGRSAGGHLALLAAYTPDEPSLPPSCEVPDTHVQTVIAFYAPTDLLWGYNNPANPDVIDGSGTLRRFLGGDPQTVSDAFHIASPINHVDANTPPTLLLHGGRDQLVGMQHAEFLEQKLSAANVPHQTVIIPYAHHGFDFNFNGWGSQIVQPIIRQFLQQHLANEQATMHYQYIDTATIR